MLISHQIALEPNNKQRTYLAKASGCARKAYNWALCKWKEQYEAWKQDNSLPKPNQMALRRQLNSIKREQFPYMLEVTKCAVQLAIMQLGQAFNNFFTKRAKYPVFRKKGIHDRFSISNDQFQIKNKQIRIPNLGWVIMTEQLRFKGKIMSATVSRRADKWYVSITVEVPDLHLPKAKNQSTVGVDLGLTSLAALSTGEVIAGPKPHKALLKRLKRFSRSLSRKEKGSSNRQKAKNRLARIHARIANIRNDALHKLTTDLTRRFQTIGIENLNVRGMQKNRKLSRSIADMGFFEFRRQLEYKAGMRGGRVMVADRFFASSKTCSDCGYKQADMPLKTREWTCPGCGIKHDRDINAAINLRNLAVSSTVIACGEGGTGSGCKPRVNPPSVKQEVNNKFIQN
jgi:putative transposase